MRIKVHVAKRGLQSVPGLCRFDKDGLRLQAPKRGRLVRHRNGRVKRRRNRASGQDAKVGDEEFQPSFAVNDHDVALLNADGIETQCQVSGVVSELGPRERLVLSRASL